ncbi:MAG: hypothetical protein D6728_15960 [Cyanobacteria bacterium J055]|nr:MAG: hypothetical protein D6728_15960 [Cyanobacteria bacterium J055]
MVRVGSGGDLTGESPPARVGKTRLSRRFDSSGDRPKICQGMQSHCDSGVRSERNLPRKSAI